MFIKKNNRNKCKKIANSWGTNVSNYTKGYVWVPYDALGSVSAVSGASAKRSPVFSTYYFIEPQKDYTPLLVADVTMKTDKRNQVAIELGVSEPEYSVNGNRLTVYSPETENIDGYKSDTKYELTLKPQIRSLGGNNLINDKKIYIYILDDFYVYW